jgi:hypothetical protein
MLLRGEFYRQRLDELLGAGSPALFELLVNYAFVRGVLVNKQQLAARFYDDLR